MKLQPSTIASILIFIVTGIFTLQFFMNQHYENLPTEIKSVLIISIIFSAIYYYFIEIVNELDNNIQMDLASVGHSEYLIRVINQTILFSLWFFIQMDNLTYFAIALLSLYLSYVIWDFVVYRIFVNNVLLLTDIAGLIFTFLFLWMGYLHINPPTSIPTDNIYRQTSWSIMWGAVIVIYLLIPIFGIFYKIQPKFLLNLIWPENKD